MKLVLGFMAILMLQSCSAPSGEGGGDVSNPIPEFQVSFSNLVTHGTILSYSVQGDATKNFGTISFHTMPDCNNLSRLNSGNRTSLVNGLVLNLVGSNRRHDLFYRVSDTDGSELIGCRSFVNYTHDSIAPLAPGYTPATFMSYNNTRTRNSIFVPPISSSYLPSDADGIRFYGNMTKTLYFGQVMRSELLSGSINLIPNSSNLFYFSFIDLAGNESSLFNTGVTVTTDSVAPVTPTAIDSLIRFTTSSSVTIRASSSVDTVRIQITHRESATVTDYTPSSVLAGVSIPSVSNATNNYDLVAYDDVGNPSFPLTYIVVNDSIAPNTPTLHADTSAMIGHPVMGPSNLFKLLMDEPGYISVYSDSGLSNLLLSSERANWVNGQTIGLINPNGLNTFYIVARDESGNTSLPLAITFTGDSIAPLNLSLMSSTLLLNGTSQQGASAALRANSNSDIYSVRISGGASTEIYLMSQMTSGVNYPLVLNSLNTLSIVSIDRAGNESSGVAFSITNDTIPPVVGISYPLSGGTISSSGTILGTCESNTIRISVGSTYYVPCVSGSFSYQLDGSFTHGAALNISVREIDNALNQTTLNIQTTIDNISPVITVDPATLPTVSSNPNHLLMGTCEIGPTLFVSGDYTGAVPCLGGFFVIPLNILSEGLKEFTLSQTDGALNQGSITFNLDFDFTPPPAVELDYSVTKLHNTAVNLSSIIIMGTSSEDVPVKIYRDAGYTDLVGVFTRSSLEAGMSLPLGLDRVNNFYVINEDQAGNKSTPALLTVFQRLSLSKKYETLQSDIYLSSDIGNGVTYKYRIPVVNESFDTNINRRIAIESLVITSPTPQIVIDPSSTCLEGELVGFGTCNIDILLTYSSVGIKDNSITITYPNGTSDTVRIQHISAAVAGSSITPQGLGSSIFTTDLFETVSSQVFLNMPNFVDFNLLQLDTSQLAIRRRVQTSSEHKRYMTCASNQLYLCSYDKSSPAMEETMFSLSISVGELDLTSPNTMFWFVGSIGNKDFLIVSKYKNSVFTSGQDSALISYDRVTKGFTQLNLLEGVDRISVQRPQSGDTLEGGILYFMGLHSLGQSLYSLNLTLGTLAKVEDVRANSGYFRVKDQLIYSRANLETVSLNLTDSSSVVINSVNPGQDLYVCKNDLFTSGKVINIDSINEFSKVYYHGVYFLCNAGLAKSKAIYTDGVIHEELLSASGNLHIQNLSVVDPTKLIVSLRDYGANSIEHFYIDRGSETISQMDDVIHDANYKPHPVYINGLIYMQSNEELIEYDLSFTPVRILRDFGHRNWYLFKSKDSPFVMEIPNRVVSYYDLEFNEWLNYISLTVNGMISGVPYFEGFYKGYIYIRNGNTASDRIVRVPLYSK